MARWEPAARERLQTAALELYSTRGFEETTVAEIARAAGLTERTFFRYFADKREVIFAGQELFQQSFSDGIATARADASPLEIVASAVIGAASFFAEDHRAFSRQRQRVIAANRDLQERELLKMASLASALAAGLRDRGVTEPAATLAAESGVTVFRVAFEQWITEDTDRSLVDIERGVFAELGALTSSSESTVASG